MRQRASEYVTKVKEHAEEVGIASENIRNAKVPAMFSMVGDVKGHLDTAAKIIDVQSELLVEQAEMIEALCGKVYKLESRVL